MALSSLFKSANVDSRYLYSIVEVDEDGDNSTHSIVEKGGWEDASTPREALPMCKLMALTCGAGGLRVFWSTVMAHLPLLLHSFGISKSATAAILVFHPLSGFFVGPIAGAYSDRLRSRWGSRRPFIVGGALATAVSLLGLAWAEDSVRLLTCSRGSCEEFEAAVQTMVRIAGIAATLILSIAVQPLQSATLSLMVDQAPASQQIRTSAWASRMTGIGGIVGFYAGSISLPDALPFMHGATQFQALAALNCLILGAVTSIVCLCVHESDNRGAALAVPSTRSGMSMPLLQLYRSVWTLPKKIKAVCRVQLCAWFGWFSFLYCTTTYITELGRVMDPNDRFEQTMFDQEARAGAFASLWFAVITLLSTFAIPSLVPCVGRVVKRWRSSSFTIEHDHSDPAHLPNLWASSQACMGLLMLAAPFVQSRAVGTLLIASCGVSWAVEQWVPFALIGHDIASLAGMEESSVGADSHFERSGTLLGIHNMAISFPQVLAGLTDSGVYTLAEVAKSSVPTSWVFVLGGFAALASAALARRIPA